MKERIALEARRPPIIPLVLLGVAERVLWNVLRPSKGAAGEAMNVAKALGAGRGFADAYHTGQGATAHLLPISSGIAGGVYRIFGVGTPSAEAVLAGWSIGLAMGTYLLLFRAFGRLGTPLWARLAALACGCLAPAYIGQEAVDFRVWEGGLTAFLAALFLDRLIAASDRAPSAWMLVGASALNALLFFINPAMGAAAFFCALLFCRKYLSWRRTLIPAGALLAALSLLLGPWALRNQQMLGEAIVLRSNVGLELALANYSDAATGDHRAKFLARLAAIHPAATPSAYAGMQAAGGEVAYAKLLERRTIKWMGEHKSEMIGLMLLHLRQALFPQPWQFDVFGRALSPTLRAALTDGVGLLGLCGIAAALINRRRNWIYPAVMVTSWALLMSPFQPAARYTYLVYPLMLFCGGDYAARIIDRVRHFANGTNRRPLAKRQLRRLIIIHSRRRAHSPWRSSNI